MLRLLRDQGPTGFELNARVHGYEVDVLWREAGLALEIDSYAAHSGPVAFERDRLKIATLETRGLTVMPVTPRQVREDPRAVLARVREAFALATARRRRMEG